MLFVAAAAASAVEIYHENMKALRDLYCEIMIIASARWCKLFVLNDVATAAAAALATIELLELQNAVL